MPEFHRLNKSRTTELSKEELNRRLRDEVKRSETKKKKAKPSDASKRQQKLSEQTKKQMPPQSPVRRKREEEMKRREKQAEKAKKKRRHGSYIIYYILLGLAAFFIFSILSVTVLFNTEMIIVEGETVYTDEEIIKASGLHGDENLVRLNLSGINKRITDALVSLDSAEVTKQFPNAIKITVKPAEPMANFYYAGKNYVISHVGRVMQIDSSAADCMEVVGYRPGESVVIGDYITSDDPEQDALIASITDALTKLEFPEITKVDITDPLTITMTCEGRILIRLGSILRLEEKLTMAKEIIENYVEPGAQVSLDVSSGERVVQRPITSAPITVPTEESTEEPPEDDPGESPEEEPGA